MFVGIRDIEKKETKSGKSYYAFSGWCEKKVYDGKIWDIEEKIDGPCVVEAQVKFDEYNGKKQVIVSNYKILEDKEYNSEDIFSTPVVDSKQAKLLLKNVGKMLNKNPYVDFVSQVYKKYMESLIVAPAGRGMHHNYKGGLVLHIEKVVKLCWLMADEYGMDTRILLPAAALHDIGKCLTIDGEEGAYEYNFDGNMLEHIYLGAEIVEKEWQTGDERDKQLIKHCILSHHGNLEWGSPVYPKTQSAVILHFADMIDSRVDAIKNQVSVDPNDGEFTDKIYPLNNVPFYKEII